MTIENGIETISINEIPAGMPVFNSVRNISVITIIISIKITIKKGEIR